MRTRFYISGTAFALTSGLLAAHCGSCFADSCTNCSVAINNPKTITLSVGQKHIIQVEANPSTGYSWELALSDPAIASASLGEIEYKEKALTGAPGKQTVTIIGVKPGSTNLTLLYKRAWEKEAPAKEEMYTIEVTGANGNPSIQTRGNPDITEETITLVSSKPGKPSHTIELPASPSTGHRWVIAEDTLPKGSKVIMGKVTYEELDQSETPAGLTKTVVGRAGTVKIEIFAGEAGTGILKLDYVGPNKQVKKSKIYTINIHE